MKKLIGIVCALLIPMGISAQNAVMLLRSLRNLKPTTICRTINVPISRSFEALAIARFQAPNAYNFTNTNCRVKVSMERQLLAHSITTPEAIYGPYKYVRAFSTAAKTEELVSPKYLARWKRINESTHYNGVHHLISRSTIKRLHADLKQSGKKVSLADMESNAPSIFHPFHGSPEYQDVFHNIDQQYFDYKRFGMKVTIISLLERIDEINVQVGAPTMTEEYLNGVLKEAELWTRFYGLTWERY